MWKTIKTVLDTMFMAVFAACLWVPVLVNDPSAWWLANATLAAIIPYGLVVNLALPRLLYWRRGTIAPEDQTHPILLRIHHLVSILALASFLISIALRTFLG